MTSSPYSPDEPHSAISQEKVWFQGILLSNFFFGMETMLCFLAFIAVFRRRTSGQRRMRTTLLVYIAILFALGASAQGLTITWIQMAFIVQRDYPGGPSAFLKDEWWMPISAISNIVSVIANWMMECLLVWRCRVVCSSGGRAWRLGVALPFLLLLGVFASGSNFIYRSSTVALDNISIIAYSVSSLALNITATALIAGRLLACRQRVVSQLGSGYGRQYLGITAVIVESAAVYTLFLLLVIIGYAAWNAATSLFQLVILQVQTITSLLIIWRVARGEGWTSSTHTEVMSTMTSSLAVHVAPDPQQNVVQLEMIPIQPDDEEAGLQRKEIARKVSFPSQRVETCRVLASHCEDPMGKP